MGNSIRQLDDNILHSTFKGDIEIADVDEFVHNVEPYLKKAPLSSLFHFVVDAQYEKHWSFAARRKFTQLFDHEPRFGKVAIFNASRFSRVVATFIMHASGRANQVRFFEGEASARTWLKD